MNYLERKLLNCRVEISLLEEYESLEPNQAQRLIYLKEREVVLVAAQVARKLGVKTESHSSEKLRYAD